MSAHRVIEIYMTRPMRNSYQATYRIYTDGVPTGRGSGDIALRLMERVITMMRMVR